MSAICIAGRSGEGKSTSIGASIELGIKGLNPAETFIINVAGKDLPFRGWKGMYTEWNKENPKGNLLTSSDSAAIAKTIEHINASMKHVKNIVIDDGQYTMAFEFMSRAKEPGYGKFADIGVNQHKIIQAAKNTRSDLKVFFLWHPEEDKDLGFKLKTVGKMVDDYLTLEGLFSIVLYTRVVKENDKMKYSFVTNHDGKYPAKSPIGMFPETYIKNDLGFVAECIDNYNNGK